MVKVRALGMSTGGAGGARVALLGVVAWLGAAGPATGDIVTGTLNTSVSIGSPTNIDVNGDGLIDLRISYGLDPVDFYFCRVSVQSDVVNFSQWTSPSGERNLARGLQPGEVVGPGSSFMPADLLGMQTYYEVINGPGVSATWGAWGSWGVEIAGFRFVDASGGIHYGWFTGGIDDSSHFITGAPGEFQLYDFAYESTPGVGIVVPGPGAGMVAAMVVARGIRRRRR